MLMFFKVMSFIDFLCLLKVQMETLPDASARSDSSTVCSLHGPNRNAFFESKTLNDHMKYEISLVEKKGTSLRTM